MTSRVKSHGLWGLLLTAAGLLLAISSCNVSNEDGHTYLGLAKDSTWDDFDSLEISWLDTVSGKSGILFRDKPEKLKSENQFLLDEYHGQSIILTYKGFQNDSLVSEVRQRFEASAPTLVKLDTVLAPQIGKTIPPAGKGPPPQLSGLKAVTLTIRDSITFITQATLDSGALASYAFDFNGDGTRDDSSSLTGLSAEIQGGYRFQLPAIYKLRLRVHSALGALTESTCSVTVVKDEPTADAVPEQTVFTGDTVRLNGVGKDSLGTIARMEWKVGEEAFAPSSGPWTFKAPLDPGDVTATFRVTDDDSQTVLSTVAIHVVARTQPTLTDLRVSSGTLSPRFSPVDTLYVDTIPYAAGAFTVTPMGNGALVVNGSAVVSGQASSDLALKVGENPIRITVSLPGVPDKNYRLNVVRLPASGNMTLAGLMLSPGSLNPAFGPQKYAYSVSVAHDVVSLTLTATLADMASNLTVKDAPQRSGTPVSLNLGVGANTIPIVVTAQDGSINTYTVQVTRAGDGNSDLAGLTVAAGAIVAPFSPEAVFYTLSVPNNVDSTQVTAKPTRVTSTLALNGRAMTSEQPLTIPLAVGANPVTLVVTAQSGDKKSYTVVITRAPNADADLAGLSLSAGDFSPIFLPSQIAYSLEVGSGTASTTVTAKASAKTSSFKVNGVTLASGDTSAAIALKVGANSITVQVTAENNVVKTYTVTVTRAADANADLSGLFVSTGALSPAFDPAKISYSAPAPNDSATVTITPTAFSGASTLKVNGNTVASGTASPALPLNLGANVFTIVVTAQNNATKIYTVTVTRSLNGNAELSELAVSAGVITPEFSTGITAYTLSVENSVKATTVTPKVAVATSTVKVNGTAVVSGTASDSIPLLAGANAIVITVTAQDNTVKTDTVTVTRAVNLTADLSNLTASVGVLTPVFADTITEYSLTVAHSITATTVTPTVATTSTSSVMVNGLAVASGSPSGSIALALGLNTIAVVVKAENGTVKTYSVNAIRRYVPKISAGGAHSLMLKNDGTLWAVGDNSTGQLGDGTTTQQPTPVSILAGSTFMQIVASQSHSLMLRSDSTLWASGYNPLGHLGDGTTTQRITPVPILAGFTFTQIAAGISHSLMLKSDGTLWATGNNFNGQLGDGGTTTKQLSPAPMLAGSTFMQIAAGGAHSLMLKSDGTLWAAGDNSSGQLGDGTTSTRRTPVPILAGSTFTQIAGGGSHSLMLKSDGTLWAMGQNGSGQLGDGTTTLRNTPVPIQAGSTFTQIAAGGNHSLMLKSDGTLWATGNNAYGQLGDGTTTNQLTPVPILAGSTFIQIAGGNKHSLMLKSDGTFWASGDNAFGQLGDGTTTNKSTPVQVLP